MNILIVSQFYAPEPCAAAHRVQALAQALAAQGDRVEVVAPHPNFPSGTIEKPYRGRFIVNAMSALLACTTSPPPATLLVYWHGAALPFSPQCTLRFLCAAWIASS